MLERILPVPLQVGHVSSTLTSMTGRTRCRVTVSYTHLGRIDVNNYYVYVAVQRNKLQEVLKRAKGQKIKGLRTIFEAAE